MSVQVCGCWQADLFVLDIRAPQSLVTNRLHSKFQSNFLSGKSSGHHNSVHSAEWIHNK